MTEATIFLSPQLHPRFQYTLFRSFKSYLISCSIFMHRSLHVLILSFPLPPFSPTAKSAKSSGADALLVTGHEAAAHGGDVTSLVLIPSIAANVPDLPLIAAGGFGDGRGLLAALSLGADAVAMGTRFACTEESPLHENVKKAITSDGQTESSTVYSKNIDGIWARVMKTPFAAEAASKRANPLVVAIEALKQAKRFGVNPLKVLPGLFMEPDKIYMLAQFGGATRKFELATVSGDGEVGRGKRE